MKILFIEKLDFLSYLYLLISKPFYEKIYYIYETEYFKTDEWLSKLKNKNIIRLNFDNIYTKGIAWEVHRKLMDKMDILFENYIENKEFYKKIINYFQMNRNTEQKFQCALKRVLCDKYYNAVKTLILINDVLENEKIVKSKFWFDAVLDLPKEIIYKFGKYRIGKNNLVIKRLKDLMIKTFYFSKKILLIIYCVAKIIKKYIDEKFLNRKYDISEKYKNFTIGYFPMLNYYHKNRFYFDTVIYDKNEDSELNPKKILHLFHGEISDKETEQFLIGQGITYLNIYTIPRGIKYFKDYLKLNIKFLKFSNNKINNILFILVKGIYFYKNIFERLNLPLYYCAYDQSFPKIAVTVMSMMNIKSISTMYGEQAYLVYYMAYYNFDYYGLPGERYKKFAKRNRFCINNYFINGVTRTDIIYENRNKILGKYKPAAEEYKIVLAVDFGSKLEKIGEFPNFPLKEKSIKNFYDTLMQLLNKYEDIYIISKLRNQDSYEYYKNDSEINNFFKPIFENKRISLDYESDTYKLIAMSDYVIANQNSTTGLESLTAGKKVLYFDQAFNKYHGYKEYGIVAYTQEELLEKFDVVYNNKDNYDWDWIRQENCEGYFDGKCRQRIRDKIIEIL